MWYSYTLTKWMADRGNSYQREIVSSANKKTPKYWPDHSPTRGGPRATFAPNTTSEFVDTSTQFKESYTEPSQADPFPESKDTFIVPNDQVEILQRITRKYFRAIGYIPIMQELPWRKSRNKLEPPSDTHSFIPYAGDLIQSVLQGCFSWL